MMKKMGMIGCMIEINKIYNGDCLMVMKNMPDNYFDSCVTDPPYGISFMNKHWDYDVPKVEVWKEVWRVLKPGGHILCACGTRTQHRMAVNIEDAGFEIRDVITWHYGSGFPKSLDVSKAIDKQSGVEREDKWEGLSREIGPTGNKKCEVCGKWLSSGNPCKCPRPQDEPQSEKAKEWQGWGTALKPATEFWTLARKPLSENTVAENVLKYGTGGINIDGSRIGETGAKNNGSGMESNIYGKYRPTEKIDYNMGRFPANVIFDEFTGKILDEQSGISESNIRPSTPQNKSGEIYGKYTDYGYERGHEDEGGASRFFYCPKADNFERNKGLKNFDKTSVNHIASETGGGGGWKADAIKNPNLPRANHHPTVKPIDLMRYLVKLITPKKGICLDPYCGSGTTLIGCKLELINYIGIEMQEEYCKIAEARVAAWNPPKFIEQKLF